jgi:hypothetical protein
MSNKEADDRVFEDKEIEGSEPGVLSEESGFGFRVDLRDGRIYLVFAEKTFNNFMGFLNKTMASGINVEFCMKILDKVEKYSYVLYDSGNISVGFFDSEIGNLIAMLFSILPIGGKDLVNHKYRIYCRMTGARLVIELFNDAYNDLLEYMKKLEVLKVSADDCLYLKTKLEEYGNLSPDGNMSMAYFDKEIESLLWILLVLFLEPCETDEYGRIVELVKERVKEKRFQEVRVFDEFEYGAGIEKAILKKKLREILSRCGISMAYTIYKDYEINMTDSNEIKMKGRKGSKYIYEIKSDDNKWKIKVTDKRSESETKYLYDPKEDKYTSLDVY